MAPVYYSTAMRDTTLALKIHCDINTTAYDDKSYYPDFILHNSDLDKMTCTRPVKRAEPG